MANQFNKTYTYPLFYRFLYRFGNIAATLFLLLYLVPLLGGMTGRLFEYFYAAVIIAALIIINFFFIRVYRTVPFAITVKDDVITGTDYFLSSKEVVLQISKVDRLAGGVFDGKSRGLMRVINTKEEKEIAFFHGMEESKNLLAYILSKVEKSLYDSVLGKYEGKKSNQKG